MESKGIKQFFVGGFCWGVYIAFKLGNQYDNFISVFGFHPSLRITELFGENVVTLAENLKCPAYFLPAENDPENIKTGGEVVEILKKRFGEDKIGTTEFP